MANLENILVMAHRHGHAAAKADYAVGTYSATPLSGEFAGGRLAQDIPLGYPEAAEVAVTLATTFETKVADEVETISEAIVDAWEDGYASFEVTDWLNDLPDEDDEDAA